MEEHSSIIAETGKHLIDYFVNDVGYGLLEVDGGFVLYDILENILIVEEMYIEPAKRGKQSYPKLYSAMVKCCLENDLKEIHGVVDLNKPNADKVMAGHLRFGCTAIFAKDNKVEFKIGVNHG